MQSHAGMCYQTDRVVVQFCGAGYPPVSKSTGRVENATCRSLSQLCVRVQMGLLPKWGVPSSLQALFAFFSSFLGGVVLCSQKETLLNVGFGSL